jgi:hypothetical protein
MTTLASTLARILLVDPNVDELSSIATALRARGFSVVLANSSAMAEERALGARFDVLLVAEELMAAEGRPSLDSLATAIAAAGSHVVLVSDPDLGREDGYAVRTDVDAIAASALRAPSVPPDGAAAPPSIQVGSLAQTPLLELVESLFVTRRTGTLGVTTPKGAGELRFAGGELVDAVYLRLDGLKALLRLLGESEGAFVFTPGAPMAVRRITLAAGDLVRLAARQLEETQRLRIALGADDTSAGALVAVESVDPIALSPLARTLLSRLRSPSTLDELLDTASEPDAELLAALAELDAAGRLRRIGTESRRLPFAPAEHVERVRALAARAQAGGFLGPARVVFAGTATRLGVLTHTALRLQEAVAPAQPSPALPVPHEIATLRLSDGAAVELFALPLVPAYSPLWAMALAGAAVLVRLDDAAAELLLDASATADMPIVDAESLVEWLDESDVGEVGSLVRAALEKCEV